MTSISFDVIVIQSVVFRANPKHGRAAGDLFRLRLTWVHGKSD